LFLGGFNIFASSNMCFLLSFSILFFFSNDS
jgi:hypothetical protein